MKKYLLFILLGSLLTFSNSSLSQTFEQELKFCATSSLWLPVLFENAGVRGEDICKAGGGSSCYNVSSIGEGICKAGGGSSCYNVSSIGEGICKAGGGSSCYNVSSIGEGICKAGGICNASTAIEIINAVKDVCGKKVLHYGFE
jgi:uncharacterized membrane protein